MNISKNCIIINEADNVAVALEDLKIGNTITVGTETITILNDIPFAHKIAIKNIRKNETIIKYGSIISSAIEHIQVGSHVHTHNTKTNLSGIINYKYNPDEKTLKQFEKRRKSNKEEYYFQGYKRDNGKAGTRNEVWIIPTVGCVNATVKKIEADANRLYGSRVDGIFAYTHNMGCSQMGEDQKITMSILKGIIENPNCAAALIVSLGCENNNLKVFKPLLGKIDENKIKFLTTQDVDNEYEEGVKLLDSLTYHAAKTKREKLPIKYLQVGFKCGGSDAFSGITANNLCGIINDKLYINGSTTILTEVPEMFGAETILMNRAIDKNVFTKIVELINNYKNYFNKYNQTIYENPSPGNKDGGISTLEEKSLGCIQKGGHSPIVDVLNYGEAAKVHGLNLLNGSGNDQVSCTNLVASGCNLIIFTTGRGNPFGSVVPTIKVSSNTRLKNKKPNWIDFNAGLMLEDSADYDVVDSFMKFIIEVASGNIKTKNEMNNYRDISIFKDGVVL